MCIRLALFLMSLSPQKKQPVIVSQPVVTVYAPPYVQPVKKRKIFFIAGNDPENSSYE